VQGSGTLLGSNQRKRQQISMVGRSTSCLSACLPACLPACLSCATSAHSPTSSTHMITTRRLHRESGIDPRNIAVRERELVCTRLRGGGEIRAVVVGRVGQVR